MSSSQGTLVQLYLAFVRPIVEYAAPVWDSHYACHIQALEKVQRFALRMSAKLWDHDYNKLLLLFGLPTLESRRKILPCWVPSTVATVLGASIYSYQILSTLFFSACRETLE